MDERDISIALDEHSLLVTTRHELRFTSESQELQRTGTTYERRMIIPGAYDTARVTASLVNGWLIVKLPKVVYLHPTSADRVTSTVLNLECTKNP